MENLVNLNNEDVEILNQTTSKGNQPKFKVNGFYYKLDTFGYESIAEALCSEFEKYIVDFPFIDYTMENVIYRGNVCCACKSKSFQKDGYDEITIYRLLQLVDINVNDKLSKLAGIDLVNYVLDTLSATSGLSRGILKEYIGRIVFFDSIVLNEDRHLNNFSLRLSKSGICSLMDVYDNGLSLLSDISDYPMSGSIPILIRKVKAKPFSTSFSKQVNYFSDIEPLKIKVDEFYSKVDSIENDIDSYIPFKQQEYKRAISVLKRRLKETEGKSWVRY